MMSLLENTTKSAREMSEFIQQQQHETGLIVEAMQAIALEAEQSLDISKRTAEIAQRLRRCVEELDALLNFLTS